MLINKKTQRMWGYSFSLEIFSLFCFVEDKAAPIAAPTPMPNTILFRDRPIATPIAIPAPRVRCHSHPVCGLAYLLFMEIDAPMQSLSLSQN